MKRLTAWRPVRRRLTALLAVLALFVLAGIALPGSASAIPGLPDCKAAPTPEVPGRGVEAFFQPAPASPPQVESPFAPGSKSSIFASYGYAGLRWHTYDLGCTGGSPEASVGSTVANWLFTIPKAVVAATGALLGAAYEPSFLRVFDPLVQTVVDALRKSVFDQWAGLVLAGLGFLIVWRARRSSLRTTAAALGWALFVMMLATVLFRWPVVAGQAADVTVTSTMSAVTTALGQNDANGRSTTGEVAAAGLHDALLYQVWLGGQFGDANSVTARRYGPALFDAQALTWAEAATLNADPAAGQQIFEAKKAKFTQIAAQVQATDPDAYEYLTGRRSDARVGFAALALLAVACAVPFLIVASLLVIGALVITRFAVMLFPVIATLGLFPAMRGLVIGVGNTVAAAIINSMVFGIGTAVMVKAFGVVMAPGNGLPSWLVVALVLLLTIVMWYALRPFQRLTGMVSPGRNHFGHAAGALGSVTRGIGRVGGRLATTAAGVFVGERVRDKAKDDDHDKDADDVRNRRRVEADSHGDPDSVGDGVDGADGVGGTGVSGGSGAGTGQPGRPGAGGGGRIESDTGRRATDFLRRVRSPWQGTDDLDGPADGRTTGPADGRTAGRRGTQGAGRGGDRARGETARDELVAAEVGLATARRPGSEVRRAASGAPARRAEDRSVAPVAQPRGRPRVRRSEGADLEDLGVHAPTARGLIAADEAADPSSVYRPPGSGGGAGA